MEYFSDSDIETESFNLDIPLLGSYGFRTRNFLGLDCQSGFSLHWTRKLK